VSLLVVFTPLLFFDIFVSGLILGSLYSIIGLAMNLQYGLLRVLNIAHGDFIMLAAYLKYWLFVIFGVSPLLVIPITLPLFFLIGVVLHRLAFQRLLTSVPVRFFEASTLLLTFGLSFVIQGFASYAWTTTPRAFSYMAFPVNVLGVELSANRVIAMLGGVLTLSAFYLFLYLTLARKVAIALLQDQIGARVVGIKLFKFHRYFFSITLALTAITGSFIAPLVYLDPFIGIHYTIIALLLLILGAGSVIGCIIGGFIIGIAETATMFLVTPTFRPMVVFIILIIILLLRPSIRR